LPNFICFRQWEKQQEKSKKQLAGGGFAECNEGHEKQLSTSTVATDYKVPSTLRPYLAENRQGKSKLRRQIVLSQQGSKRYPRELLG
jgi:hypothetical protein